MSGDTAKLLASLDLQDQMSPKLKAAMGNVSAAERGIGSLGTRLSGLASNLRGGVSNALSTFGGRLKQFGLGLAAAAGVGGLLSFGGALERSLAKAQEWGSAIERLGPITGDTAEQLSGLLAVTEKFGIGLDQVVKVAGFESKAIEGIALKAKGAAAFQKAYGFSILDASGKVKDFNTVLLTFSDYYVKNTNVAQKNAAAAKLFGRSYTDLIPVLALGAKGIADAEAEAKALGLTLTQDNVAALAKAREATRRWGDAIGGLELQLGLALLPQLTDLATWASGFVQKNGPQIIAFFKGAAAGAEHAAGVIGDLVGTAQAFWNKLPPEFRDLLMKGLVADRAVKFLFGFSPISAATGVFGAFLGRGSSPANPMFVSGGGIGGPAGAGPASLIPALIAGAGIVALGAVIADAVYKALGGIPVGQPGHSTSGTPIGTTGINVGMSQGEFYRTQGQQASPAGQAAGAAAFARFTAQTALAAAGVHNFATAVDGLAVDTKVAISKLTERLSHPLAPHSEVNRLLTKADKIALSSESTSQKIADLQKIKDKLDAGDHHQAYYLQRIIDAEKRTLAVNVTVPLRISIAQQFSNAYESTSTLNRVVNGQTTTVASRT